MIDGMNDTIQLLNPMKDKFTSFPLQLPTMSHIISVLTKELIKARESQASAMVKLRVAAQSEIQLHASLDNRDKRIKELKTHFQNSDSIWEEKSCTGNNFFFSE